MTRATAALGRVDHPLAREVLGLACAVAEHPVFASLRTITAVREFMRHHVWAVWDFMSLLKSLQAELAPTRVPWVPLADPEAGRLINEIVVGEEGDDGLDGHPTSHFEIYLAAMEDAGADPRAMRTFLDALGSGQRWGDALASSTAPDAAKQFVARTLTIAGGPLPARVGAFALGREEVIPGMFRAAVRDLGALRGEGANLSKFQWYLERHVEVDDERHGPLAARLFQRVCLQAEPARTQALTAARDALGARLALWDAIADGSNGNGGDGGDAGHRACPKPAGPSY